jgi:hypothetical protein
LCTALANTTFANDTSNKINKKDLKLSTTTTLYPIEYNNKNDIHLTKSSSSSSSNNCNDHAASSIKEIQDSLMSNTCSLYQVIQILKLKLLISKILNISISSKVINPMDINCNYTLSANMQSHIINNNNNNNFDSLQYQQQQQQKSYNFNNNDMSTYQKPILIATKSANAAGGIKFPVITPFGKIIHTTTNGRTQPKTHQQIKRSKSSDRINNLKTVSGEMCKRIKQEKTQNNSNENHTSDGESTTSLMTGECESNSNSSYDSTFSNLTDDLNINNNNQHKSYQQITYLTSNNQQESYLITKDNQKLALGGGQVKYLKIADYNNNNNKDDEHKMPQSYQSNSINSGLGQKTIIQYKDIVNSTSSLNSVKQKLLNKNNKNNNNSSNSNPCLYTPLIEAKVKKKQNKY